MNFKGHIGMNNEVNREEDDGLKSRGHILFYGYILSSEFLMQLWGCDIGCSVIDRDGTFCQVRGLKLNPSWHEEMRCFFHT